MLTYDDISWSEETTVSCLGTVTVEGMAFEFLVYPVRKGWCALVTHVDSGESVADVEAITKVGTIEVALWRLSEALSQGYDLLAEGVEDLDAEGDEPFVSLDA
jgi:hypothetical protein